MGRAMGVIRTGVVLAVAVAGAAGARAQPSVSIEDARVVEGSGGSWDLDVTVRLSTSSMSTVSVPWGTVDGSAISGQDFAYGSGTVFFFPPDTVQTLSVSLAGDTQVEWDPTVQRDEAFFIDLGAPTNATLLKRRATVTLVDDDRPAPGLQLVSAVADGGPSPGRVRLQWRVPASTVSGPPIDVLVRWNEGSACSPPADSTVPVTGSEFLLFANRGIPVGAPGQTQIVPHLNRPLGLEHCYALFAVYPPSTVTMERATVTARPFNLAAPNFLAWAYSAGGAAPSVVPPTVGLEAVYTIGTDGVVHAMERGETGGAWPAAWNPVGLGKAAHNRSPVVPLPYGQRLFVGTESGEVHAVDGTNGSIAWSRSPSFNGLPPLPAIAGAVQGTPAGLFTSFAGLNDLILVGSNQSPSNTFFILDPVTGATGPTYSNGAMGGIPGMPTVDYPNNRVFFVTTSTAGTLWAFDLGVPGTPALDLSPLAGGNPVSFPGSGGSPVLRSGRVYFGASNGDVAVHRVSDGMRSAVNVADGPVKGFVFPDRRNADLYFSTTNSVWAVRDTVDPAPPGLSPGPWFVDDIPAPSIVLHWPNTDLLYVGGGDGRLYQIDVASPDPKGTKKFVQLDTAAPFAAIGAPSLDLPNSLVLVGSTSGVVYAVRVPIL